MASASRMDLELVIISDGPLPLYSSWFIPPLTEKGTFAKAAHLKRSGYSMRDVIACVIFQTSGGMVSSPNAEFFSDLTLHSRSRGVGILEI